LFVLIVYGLYQQLSLADGEEHRNM